MQLAACRPRPTWTSSRWPAVVPTARGATESHGEKVLDAGGVIHTPAASSVNWLAAEGRAARKLVLVRGEGRGAEAGAGA